MAPHPATVAQPRLAAHPATLARRGVAPHPATVAQRSEDVEAKVKLPQVELVAPGIAVQLPVGTPSGAKFVKLVGGLLSNIAETSIGQELLAEFDPRNKANTFNQIDGGGDGRSGGVYKGITLLVTPVVQPKLKSPKLPNPLETKDFFGTDVKTGKNYFPDPTDEEDQRRRIPIVKFWDVTLGDYKTKTKVITAKGIEAHPDLSKGIWPLETAMFHELCHAYLFQVNISSVVNDTQEEYFVTGLGSGIGWKFSENTYRAQSKQEPRISYLDLGIKSPEAAEFEWGDNDKPPADILKDLGIKTTPWTERTKRWT